MEVEILIFVLQRVWHDWATELNWGGHSLFWRQQLWSKGSREASHPSHQSSKKEPIKPSNRPYRWSLHLPCRIKITVPSKCKQAQSESISRKLSVIKQSIFKATYYVPSIAHCAVALKKTIFVQSKPNPMK